MRYLRLYAYFLRFSFSRALEFRLDFFFRILMDSFFYAVNLLFFSILYTHTDTLAGLSEDEIYIFVAGYLFLDAVHMTLFSNNMWMLPFLVNRGDLDYYLVRPVSTLFFLSLREFAANSFLNLILASGILAWAIGRYPHPLGAWQVTVFVVLLLVGTALYYALNMLFTVPVFWTHSAQGFRQLFFAIGTLGERPHPIFTGWSGRLLRTVLPFSLMVSYPTYLLLDGYNWTMLLELATGVGVTFALMLFLWSRGLRAYSSASS